MGAIKLSARLAAALLLGGITAASSMAQTGCVGRPAYSCDSNAACVRDGEQGICEPGGSCSFVDVTCPGSGRRFADGAAEDKEGACVAAKPNCVAQIAAGDEHTCVLKTDGSAWCWGSNSHGEGGDGSPDDAKPSPTPVAMPPGITFASIQAGVEHTCALATDGSVWCWGDNGDGQIGVADASGAPGPGSSTPVKVEGIPAASFLGVGGKHTCIIDAAGSVWCWGEGGKGQIGGEAVNRARPSQVKGLSNVTLLGLGDEHSCAMSNELVFCWGSNAAGQLADPSIPDQSSAPSKVIKLESVTDLVSGDEHVCAMKKDGSLYCWGYNNTGAVGNNSTTDQMTAVSVLGDVADVWTSGSAFHTCAATHREVGALWCWGQNDMGQTGTGTTEKALVPTRAQLVSVTAAALGGHHTCALTRDGATWCWGDNARGQLGIGKLGVSVKTPTRVAVCP